MKIVVLDGGTLNPGDLSWDGIKQYGQVTVYDGTQPSQTVSRIGDAEIVFTNKTILSAEILHQCSNLSYIGVLATGYNVVDIEAAKEMGIVVTNVPTYGTRAVSQHVFALLLEITTRVGHHDNTVKKGKWSSQSNFCYWDYPLMELADKTMGIVGYGRIGKETAAIASAFGMKVIAYTNDIRARSDEVTILTSLDAILEHSDVISLHCPLTDENYHMINNESIAKMKTGSILINTSRGPLVNEKDLYEALKNNRIYAAGLDVVEVEPIQADNPLLTIDNCLITPHIAWAPLESRSRLMDIAVSNLASFLVGNIVNQVGK